MTILLIDGPRVGDRVTNLPKGYHCCFHLDNHPDIASFNREYDRHKFIVDLIDGVEMMTDENTAINVVNQARHGNLTVLAKHVVDLIVATNEAIVDAQEASRHVK